MNDQQTILERLGKWIRGNGRDGDLPLSDHETNAIEPRGTFLRPWARRDQAINNLQEGFGTLTDLMSTIRDGLQDQSKRQDELLAYLSHLPEALQTLPENSRVHGETLRAIHQQLGQQNVQQEKLSEILEKLSESSGDQREALNEVREHMENVRQTDEAISSNMTNLGAALQNVSHNSTAGAQVLEQMRDRINDRDSQLESLLHKQGIRNTTMQAVAIFLSISALVAVCVVGYLVLQKSQ